MISTSRSRRPASMQTSSAGVVTLTPSNRRALSSSEEDNARQNELLEQDLDQGGFGDELVEGDLGAVPGRHRVLEDVAAGRLVPHDCGRALEVGDEAVLQVDGDVRVGD